MAGCYRHTRESAKLERLLVEATERFCHTCVKGVRNVLDTYRTVKWNP